VQTVLRLQDGQPLLLEKGLGRGHVLFFTSSADRDWTDLPTHTAYVPLLHGLISYAAQLSTAAPRPEVFLPGPLRLPGRAEDVGATLAIRAPDGREYLERYVAAGDRASVTIETYTIPGIYHVTTPVETDFVAVQATRVESDFIKLRLADVRAHFHPLPVTLEEETTFGQTVASTILPTRELASMVLLLLVAVLMVENVCANRF
jgi:hypothetical protein